MKGKTIVFTKFEKDIIAKAKKRNKIIVFPEGQDKRIREATKYLKKNKIVQPIFVEKTKKLQSILKKEKNTTPIIDVKENAEKYIKKIMKIRKHKGITKQRAQKMLEDPIYTAILLIEEGKAHGVVSGAAHPTAHTLRPAIQLIKVKKGFKKISSYFIMTKQKETYFFADCAVQIEPDATDLAEITTLAIQSAKGYGIKPKVALLSFSTKGSASHPQVQKVQQATQLAKKQNKTTSIDGEFQFDAAFVPQIRKRKAPKSNLKGIPNIFIFPDLQSGNISYKIVERIGKYDAIGPIVQGLKKPVNDLSRGCNVKDIILVAAITALQE